MEKLELKHLAAYLPYDIKGMFRNREETLKSCTKVFINREILYDDFKPILRPLSDLVNVITHKGKDFVPCIEYNHFNEYFEELSALDYSYVKYNQNRVVLILLELHFDIFGLIEKNLAVDINTI